MWSPTTVSSLSRQHVKIEGTRKWQPSVTAGSPPGIVSWRIRVSQAMAGQCVVFNSSISYACFCHPSYPKIRAGLLKVWNTFLKEFILGSQDLWHSSWELNSLLHGVAFKLWEYWEWVLFLCIKQNLAHLPNCSECLTQQRKCQFVSQGKH